MIFLFDLTTADVSSVSIRRPIRLKFFQVQAKSYLLVKKVFSVLPKSYFLAKCH